MSKRHILGWQILLSSKQTKKVQRMVAGSSVGIKKVLLEEAAFEIEYEN